jgi:glyoxylase-like metal-dependent hydrolase (beta-lactamase superfamily II)
MDSLAMSRRTFALAAVAALSGYAIGGPAHGQVIDPRPPTIDTSDPTEIADGVWILPDHRIWLVPNIGIIVGRDAALVVDCGLGPANGERVLNIARQIAGSRRLLLTMTHFHPEHGYGAQVFRPDATIIYNRAQRDELQEKGARYIDLFRQTQGKDVAHALEDTRIVMPHFVYDGDRAEIDLGGRTVELHNWGVAHTRGDQIVFLPKERILFAGDLIEERMFPIVPWFPPADTEVDSIRWVDVLNGFQRFDPQLIVPGHGDPGGIDIALNLAGHIETVGRHVRALRASGKSAQDILSEYKPEIVSAYPSWEHPALIDWEINYFASQPA